MKKLMTMVVGAALVFAVAGQASASTLETKGEFRGRYWYLNNYAKVAEAGAEDNEGFWDQRLRLYTNWQVSEGVKVGTRCDILEEVWGTSDNEIDFDQAFAQFVILPPVSLTIGKQDVSWGQGMYAKADNRYRAKAAGKFGDLTVSAAWDVNVETFNDNSRDDSNGFTLGVLLPPVAGWNLGILGVYALDESVAGLKNSTYAIDVTGSGAAGPAKINFEAAYGLGKKDFDAPQEDVDKSGIMAYVGAFMPAGPIGLGVELAYASGNDSDPEDEEGMLYMDYNGPFSSFILFNNFDLDGWNTTFSGGADKGLNNAMACKVSGTFAMNEKVSFMLAGVYARADQAVDDKNMGVEVDALAKYMPVENVTAQVGVGHLFAGEFYGTDVDDPTVATVQFIVNF